MSVLKAAADAFVGITMGVIGHLPGASGSTVAVVFKVYERLVEDIADFRHKIRKDYVFIIPIVAGLIAGTILCAKILDPLMDNHRIALYFLFLALILCQVPDIYILGNDGTELSRGNIIAFLLGLAAMAVIKTMGFITGEQTEGDWVSMCIAGVIFAIASITPGISSSTLLLAIGFYGVYNSMMANFDFSLILPFLAGFFAGLILFSKLIDYAMKHHRKSTYMMTLGLTIGSVATIFADALKLVVETTADPGMWGEIFLGAAVGLAFGLVLRKLAHMYPDGRQQDPSVSVREASERQGHP